MLSEEVQYVYLRHYLRTFDLMLRSQQMSHRLKQLANDPHVNCGQRSMSKTLEQMLRGVGHNIQLY